LVIGGLLGVGNEPKPEQEIMKVNERDEVSAVAGDLVGERGLADESVLPASCSGVPNAAAGPRCAVVNERPQRVKAKALLVL
jgi:hypothetical protein